MASLKKKGAVSKDDLKRLMKQSTIQKNERRIESPLAKYDSLGNLYCALCSSKVKNNLHWKAHIQGRTHKENLEDLKLQAQRKQEATVPLPCDSKRKRSSTSPPPGRSYDKSLPQNKKSKVPGDFFDSKASTSNPHSQGNNTVTSLQLGSYGSSDDSDYDEHTAEHTDGSKLARDGTNSDVISSQSTSAENSGLPTDFFDSGVVASKSVGDADKEGDSEEDKTKSMADKLPEGFFDDPKKDAKAREIKYVDKGEEEWERFQRAIKEENIVSEQIQEEDEEEKQAERNVEEIDEHIYHWSKVEQLHEQKEKVMTTGKSTEQQSEDSSHSDVDEKEYEEFLDWRTKKV